MMLLQGRRAHLFTLIVFLLGAAWTWVNRLPEVDRAPFARIAAPHADFAAPPLALSAVTGETFELGALKGKVVLINFWATWCPPCRAEMPALEAVHRAYRDAGLVVLAVDQMEDAASVQAFGAQLNLSYPLLLDPDGTANRRYQVRALPTTFFVDREGIIRDVTVGGPMSRELIMSKVSTLLARKITDLTIVRGGK